MTATSYTIKLPQFEGPFDLLLFFIERDELDIHDIPIATITNDFLSYLRHMESLNIDLASEFILVAATLMRIKAKLLIPRKELDEEGNEIDPREELVQRLLEYKRYKSILDEMRQLEEARSGRSVRGNASKELQSIATKALVDIELESLTLFKLLRTFERIMQRMEDAKIRAVHKVYRYNHTVRGQKQYILDFVELGTEYNFEHVFGACQDRIHAIITFLAMLELLNIEQIKITQGLGTNNFWLIKNPDFQAEAIIENTEKETEDE